MLLSLGSREMLMIDLIEGVETTIYAASSQQSKLRLPELLLIFDSHRTIDN